MASANWMKATTQKAGAMKKHLGQIERIQGNHSNKDIDKSLSVNNYSIGCSDYAEALASMKRRTKEVDAVIPPKRIRKDRVTCCFIELPCPRRLTQCGQSDDFFKLAYDELCAFFGNENVHGGFVHKDEVHRYVDKDKKMRVSMEHMHVLVSAYTPEKGINGKAFETKSRLKTLNDNLDDMCVKQFRVKLNTKETPEHKSVERLKEETKLRNDAFLLQCDVNTLNVQKQKLSETLDEFRKEYQEKSEELLKKNKEIRGRKYAVTVQEDELIDKQNQLQSDITQAKKWLQNRSEELDKREVALNSRETALDGREAQLQADTAQVKKRLQERSEELDKREVALNSKETALNGRKAQLQANTAKAEKRLQNRSEELDKREVALNSKETALNGREAQLQADTAQAEKQLQERSAKLSEREAALNDEKIEIDSIREATKKGYNDMVKKTMATFDKLDSELEEPKNKGFFKKKQETVVINKQTADNMSLMRKEIIPIMNKFIKAPADLEAERKELEEKKEQFDELVEQKVEQKFNEEIFKFAKNYNLLSNYLTFLDLKYPKLGINQFLEHDFRHMQGAVKPKNGEELFARHQKQQEVREKLIEKELLRRKMEDRQKTIQRNDDFDFEL